MRRKKIASLLIALTIGATPLYGVEVSVPEDEDSTVLPEEPVAFDPYEEEPAESNTLWKRAGMILFTIATITAGIAVASSNNGKSV